MKKIKLGLVILLSVFAFSISTTSCSTDNESDVSFDKESSFKPKNGVNEVHTLGLSVTLQDNSIVEGKMFFTIDGDSGELVGVDISPELLDPATGIDPVQFQADLVTFGEHSDCINACRDKFIDPATGKVKVNPETNEPIPGYGGCRFNCWVDTTVKVLEHIATIAKAVPTVL